MEDRPYNISLRFLENVLLIRQRISDFSFNGEVFAWYRGLNDLWNMVFFELTDEENKDIEAKLNAIKIILNRPDTKASAQLLRSQIPMVEDKLNELTRILFVYLNNHERIFQHKQFPTWQDEVLNDFS